MLDNPIYPSDGAIVRSACSNFYPTEIGLRASNFIYNKFKSGETNLNEMNHEVRELLMKYYQLPEGTGIFLTSSEADAQYIPIMLAK